jgi:hypothetical protein
MRGGYCEPQRLQLMKSQIHGRLHRAPFPGLSNRRECNDVVAFDTGNMQHNCVGAAVVDDTPRVTRIRVATFKLPCIDLVAFCFEASISFRSSSVQSRNSM